MNEYIEDLHTANYFGHKLFHTECDYHAVKKQPLLFQIKVEFFKLLSETEVRPRPTSDTLQDVAADQKHLGRCCSAFSDETLASDGINV